PLQVSMFKTFRKFMNFYLRNISWNEDRLHGEVEKFAKHLAEKLKFLKQKILIEKEMATGDLSPFLTIKKSRNIIQLTDQKYTTELSNKIEIIKNYLQIGIEKKNLIKERALELFCITLKNGMTPSDLHSKNTSVLSIVFTFFSLLDYNYLKITINLFLMVQYVD
ncbi:MAG: hypothetical protein ACTSUT_09865, partial [Promethearchaeota archaeon]